MIEISSSIDRCPLFDGIEPKDLNGLLQCLGAKTLSMRKNDFILREGDPAVYVGIVLHGCVQMIREDYYGNRSIIAHMTSGELFGESYAFSGVDVLPISVQADADSTIMLLECRRITQPCCNACAFHSKIIFNLLRLVAMKNLIFDQKIEVTSKRTTREKLIAYLLNEAKLQGSHSFTIPYDRQALADYLEVDRSGLSAEISKLRKEKKLECVRNHFTLL